MRQQSQEEKQKSKPAADCDNNKKDQILSKSEEENIINLLIDFNSEDILSTVPQQSLMQNTWVSFDEEPQICENSYLMNSKAFENSMWGKNMICS